MQLNTDSNYSRTAHVKMRTRKGSGHYTYYLVHLNLGVVLRSTQTSYICTVKTYGLVNTSNTAPGGDATQSEHAPVIDKNNQEHYMDHTV